MKNEKKERKCPSSDSRTTTAISNRNKNGKKTRKKEGIEEGAQIRREFLFIVSIFINRNKKKNEKKEKQLEDIQIRSKKL